MVVQTSDWNTYVLFFEADKKAVELVFIGRHGDEFILRKVLTELYLNIGLI